MDTMLRQDASWHADTRAYGKFVEEPTRPELERLSFLNDVDRELIGRWREESRSEGSGAGVGGHVEAVAGLMVAPGGCPSPAEGQRHHPPYRRALVQGRDEPLWPQVPGCRAPGSGNPTGGFSLADAELNG
jgi:hypothetical protein